jgi:hypothetical protein
MAATGTASAGSSSTSSEPAVIHACVDTGC